MVCSPTRFAITEIKKEYCAAVMAQRHENCDAHVLIVGLAVSVSVCVLIIVSYVNNHPVRSLARHGSYGRVIRHGP